MKKKALLFDIDGVVASTPHWEDYFPGESFDFDRWKILLDKYQQRPLRAGIDLVDALRSEYADHVVIFLTGRFGRLELKTREFIDESVVNYSPYILYMRPDQIQFTDMSDVDFKEKVLTERILPYFDVTLAVDDRLSISKMYDKHGVPSILMMNKYSEKR